MRPIALTLGVVIFFAAELCAETVDRIAVSIGNIGITQSEIEQEHRFERFMNAQPQSVEPGAAELAAARDRLLKQTLLTLEAEAEGTDSSGLAQEAGRMLDQIRKLYPSEMIYRSALAELGLSEDRIVHKLMAQVRILRVIDQRLRPNAWVEPSEIKAYYDKTFVPEHKQGHGTPPPLEEVESQIREILLQHEVDQLLEEWLKEIESSRRVKLHPS